MGLTVRLERLLPDIAGLLRRFPLCVVSALLLCGYALYNGGRYFFDGVPLCNALIAIFFAGGIGHLAAESRKTSPVANVLLATACSAIAAALVYFNATFQTSLLFFFGGVALLLTVAPFLRSGVKQGAVWLFNLRLALALLLALVVGVVVGLGLSAVVAGLKFLLNIDFGRDTYERIWIVATTVVGPLYGLSLIPLNLDEEIDLADHHGSLLERGVSILVNYVMVPLALVYALILHAYAVKIAFLQSLPKGEIGIIVSLFAVGGTMTWLIGWPWREQGTQLLRWFMRGWFWLLPVPAVLLSIAVWRRVSDYGVTPDRYGIALVAVWTALVFAYLMWRRRTADMRVIVGSAAALLLAGSFGPQGAFSTTAESQVRRLKVVLERVGVLKNGKIVSQLPVLNNEDQSVVRSMVDAVARVQGIPRLASWYIKAPQMVLVPGENWWSVANDVSFSLGAGNAYVSDVRAFSLEAIAPVSLGWNGPTEIAGPFALRSGQSGATPDKRFRFELKDDQFTVTVDGENQSVNIPEIAAAVEKQTVAAWDKKTPVIIQRGAHITLIFQEAYGVSQPKPRMNSMVFWIVKHE